MPLDTGCPAAPQASFSRTWRSPLLCLSSFGFETGRYVLEIDSTGLPARYDFVNPPKVVVDLVEGEAVGLSFPLRADQ